MNHPKRRATDELLPTTRPAKVPRSTSSIYLQSSTEADTLLPTEPLTARWVQLAEEVYTLAGDTAGVMFGSVLRGVGALFSRADSAAEDPESSPSEPRDSLPPPSPSPSIVTASPLKQHSTLPSELPSSPRRRQPASENAVASSSTQRDIPIGSQSMGTVTHTGLPTPSLTETSSSSSSTSFLGSHPELTNSQRILAAMREATRQQHGPLRKQKPRRRHIFEERYKKEVQEDRIKTREEMIDQLWRIRRERGEFKGSKVDFRGWLDYRAHLEKLGRIEALEPSPSLVNLHEPAPFPELIRSQTVPVQQASDSFIYRALQNAKESLKSKPPPCFSPALDKLRAAKQMKEQEIQERLRPKKKVLPASLPPNDEAEVDTLLCKRGVISKCVREQVSDKDLQRLRPGQWLNDEVINFYGQMLLQRSEEAGSAANKENHSGRKVLDVHYFSTFFWSKLTGEGYEKARLAKWTKKIDIFSKDIVLVPINHGNMHWAGAAINFRQKRIESYDSMSMPRQHINVYRALRSYLDAEHRNKKKTPFDFTGWEDYTPEDTPQQENGYDCGVFTCQFLESLSRGEDGFPFSQTNMTYLRRRMIWEIGHAKLRDDT